MTEQNLEDKANDVEGTERKILKVVGVAGVSWTAIMAGILSPCYTKTAAEARDYTMLGLSVGLIGGSYVAYKVGKAIYNAVKSK